MLSSPEPRSAPVSWLSAWVVRGRVKPFETSDRRWKSPWGTVKVTAIGVI
jgi:hypothetical protein